MMVKLILLFAGMLIGCLSVRAYYKAKQKREYEGTLRIVYDDDEDPYLFLELSIDPTLLTGKKDITLQIKAEDMARGNSSTFYGSIHSI